MKNIPKWFKGEIYKNGGTVTNPYSGVDWELDNIELSIYDFIIGCVYIMERTRMPLSVELNKTYRKSIYWFRKNNPEAYMVLLD